MSLEDTTLHLVCGKIAAGKSTLTRNLAKKLQTIVVSEDDWLARLYPEGVKSLADYVRCSRQLKDAMTGHLVAVLRNGLSVVLDFPANRLDSRAWMRSLFEQAGCRHELHYLDVPDEVCKARLRLRNAEGQHEFHVSDEDFALITSHFMPPTPEEGFHVITHRP